MSVNYTIFWFNILIMINRVTKILYKNQALITKTHFSLSLSTPSVQYLIQSKDLICGEKKIFADEKVL